MLISHKVNFHSLYESKDVLSVIVGYLTPQDAAILRLASHELKKMSDQFVDYNKSLRDYFNNPLDQMIKIISLHPYENTLYYKNMLPCLEHILHCCRIHKSGAVHTVSYPPKTDAIYLIVQNLQSKVQKTDKEIQICTDVGFLRFKNAVKSRLLSIMSNTVQKDRDILEVLYFAIQEKEHETLEWLAQNKGPQTTRLLGENIDSLRFSCSNFIFFLVKLLENQTTESIKCFQEKIFPLLNTEEVSYIFAEHLIVSKLLYDRFHIYLEFFLLHLSVNDLSHILKILNLEQAKETLLLLKKLETNKKLLLLELLSKESLDLVGALMFQLSKDELKDPLLIDKVFRHYSLTHQLNAALLSFKYLSTSENSTINKKEIQFLVDCFFSKQEAIAVRLLEWLDKNNLYVKFHIIINESINNSPFATKLNEYLDREVNMIEYLTPVIQEEVSNIKKKHLKNWNRFLSFKFGRSKLDNTMLETLEPMINVVRLTKIETFTCDSIFYFIHHNFLHFYQSELHSIQETLSHIPEENISVEIFESIACSVKNMSHLREKVKDSCSFLKKDETYKNEFDQFIDLIRNKIGQIEEIRKSISWLNAINAAVESCLDDRNEVKFIECIKLYLDSPQQAKLILQEDYLEIEVETFDEKSDEYSIEEESDNDFEYGLDDE